jgi:TonB family protein
MKSRLLAVAGVSLAVVAFASQPFAQTRDTFGQGANRPGNGISPPQLVRQVQPKYTADALRAKIEGDVELEAVVKADGTVGDVRVSRSLDPGLDAEAVKAARMWLFKPGTDRDGRPVPVIVTLMLSFRTGRSAILDQAPFAARLAADEDFAKGACRATSGSATAPKLVSQVEPKYTSDALRAKIEGTVTVEAVVNQDGTVARARVVKSLDTLYGLDDQALSAVSQWTFEPDSGKCAGVPAPTLVTLVLSFRIH